MVAVYAIFTLLGTVAVLGWVALGIAASASDGKEHLDPEARFGEMGRTVVSAVFGFGLAGMSASFAGWNTGLSALAAIAGAVVAVIAGRYLGVEEDSDGDSA